MPAAGARAPTTLVVFDLDGTLVDSSRDLAESANQLVVERGGQPLSQEAVVGMVGEGAALLVQRALTAAHLPPAVEALARFLGTRTRSSNWRDLQQELAGATA